MEIITLAVCGWFARALAVAARRAGVTGMQKLAVCYGPNNQTGTCKWDPQALKTVGDPRFCNSTTYSFTVASNGSVKECTGGDHTKP